MKSKYRIRNTLLAVIVLVLSTFGPSQTGWSSTNDPGLGEKLGDRQAIQSTSGASVEAGKHTTDQAAETARQQAPDKPNAIGLPIVPFVIGYDPLIKYMAQSLDNTPDYLGIEAIVLKEGASPICEMVLIDKAKSKRIFYTNSDAKAKLLTSMGRTAYFTPITYKVEQSLGEQQQHNFAFKDEKGRSFQWRFVQAVEPNVSSKGVAHISLPLGLMFRLKAAAAGEGTVLQIDDKVIEAQAWPEYSQPPYLEAYKGTICVEGVIGGLVTGNESWQVKSAPQRAEIGAQWVLTDASNNSRQLKVIARNGDEMTIREVGANAPVIEPMTLVMKETLQGLSLKSITYSAGKHLLRITLKPELNIADVMQSGKKASAAFQIDIGSEDKAVEGMIDAVRNGDMVELTSRQTSPDWAQAVTLQSQVSINASGYKVASKSVGTKIK